MSPVIASDSSVSSDYSDGKWLQCLQWLYSASSDYSVSSVSSDYSVSSVSIASSVSSDYSVSIAFSDYSVSWPPLLLQ